LNIPEIAKYLLSHPINNNCEDFFNKSPQEIIQSQALKNKFLNQPILSSSLKKLCEEKLYIPSKLNKGSNNSYDGIIFNFCSILNPRFSPVVPNDAKDFLIFILERIHCELNKPNNKINNDNDNFNESFAKFFSFFAIFCRSVITDQFNWINESISTCKNCKNNTFHYQTFPYLVLDLERTRKEQFKIAHFKKIKKYKMEKDEKSFNKWYNEYYQQKENIFINLKDCIDYYINKENKYNISCQFCYAQNQNILTNKIYSSPNIFIFILNRGKNNIHDVKMKYPQTLDLTGYIILDVSPKKYELIGVVTHLGFSGSEGHFIAFCKSPIDGKWFRYNDDKVSEADNHNIYNEGKAYILFYRKVDIKILDS
jgi:ubiquitin C-terminal hydrolase